MAVFVCLLISKLVSKRKQYESLSVFKPVPSRSDSYCSVSLENTNTRSWAIETRKEGILLHLKVTSYIDMIGLKQDLLLKRKGR